MSKARQQANLSSDGNLFADISNDRVGIGSVVPTHKLHVNGTSKFDDDVKFEGTTAARNIEWDKSADTLNVSDNTKFKFGDSGDLEIWHDGSQTNYVQAIGTARDLVLKADRFVKIARTTGGTIGFQMHAGNEVGLYHGGDKKINTTSTGAKITGNLEVTGVLTYEDVTSVDSVGIVTARDHIKIKGDNKSLYLGASDDFQLFHNGSHNIIKSNNGNLYLQDDDYIEIGDTSGKVSIGCVPSGATNLRHNGTTKLATTSYGASLDYKLVVGGGAGYPGIVQLKEGGALSEIRVTRNSDANSDLQFKTERGDGTQVRAKINYSGDFVVPDNKVGIGTDDAGRALTIRNAEPRIRLIDDDTGSFSEIYTDNSGHLYLSADQGQSNGGSRIIFNVDNDEKVRINNTGNVGIGTVNPNAPLDVFSNTAATDKDLFMVRSSTGALAVQCSNIAAANPEWRLRTYSSEDIVFSPGGTGSSAEKLRIASDGIVTARGELRLTQGTSVVSNGDEIGSLMYLYPSNDNKNAKIVALQNGGSSGADLAFYTRTQGDGTNTDGGEERLRISSTGQVHLNGANSSTTGTSATDLLMANGATVRFRNAADNGWINSFGLDNSNNLKLGWGGSVDEIHFGISGIGEHARFDSSGNFLVGRTTWVDNHFDNGIYLAGSTQAGMKFMRTASGSAGTWDIGIDTDRHFKFVYAGDSGGTGAERVRITSGGDINVHNTTAASTTDPITVDLGGQYTANASVTQANLKLKLYHNGSNGDAQGLTASAEGLAYVSSSTTNHIFYTVPSSVNSLEERLRITSGGSVLINSTSNNGASNSGQTPVLYANGYSNLGGLRIKGGDDGNTIYKEGGNLCIVIGDTNSIILKTNGAERLKITEDGDIFINQSGIIDNAKLNIKCDATQPAIAIQANHTNTDTKLISAWNSSGKNIVNITAESDNSPYLKFQLWSTTTNSALERFRVNHLGNVAIGGGIAASNRLEIIGDHKGFETDSAQPNATLLIKHGTSGSDRRWIGIGASTTGAWLQSSSPGGSGLAAPFWINKGGGDVTIGSSDKLVVKHSGGYVNIGGFSQSQGQLGILNTNDFNSASITTNTDNLWLVSDATSGDGVYGASIGFSRVQYADRRAAAIVTRQYGSDEDQVGLSFFTHPSTNATDPVEEKLRITAGGQLIQNTNHKSGSSPHQNSGWYGDDADHYDLELRDFNELYAKKTSNTNDYDKIVYRRETMTSWCDIEFDFAGRAPHGTTYRHFGMIINGDGSDTASNMDRLVYRVRPGQHSSNQFRLDKGGGGSGFNSQGTHIPDIFDETYRHVHIQIRDREFAISINGTKVAFGRSDSALVRSHGFFGFTMYESGSTNPWFTVRDFKIKNYTENFAMPKIEPLHEGDAAIVMHSRKKWGRMEGKRIHTGSDTDATAVNILHIDEWQSTNSRIIVKVEVMGISPVSEIAFFAFGSAYCRRGGSNTTSQSYIVNSMEMQQRFGNNSSYGSLSWSGQNLRYVVPSVAYFDLHLNVEYHVYDGGDVSFDTTYRSV